MFFLYIEHAGRTSLLLAYSILCYAYGLETHPIPLSHLTVTAFALPFLSVGHFS